MYHICKAILINLWHYFEYGFCFLILWKDRAFLVLYKVAAFFFCKQGASNTSKAGSTSILYHGYPQERNVHTPYTHRKWGRNWVTKGHIRTCLFCVIKLNKIKYFLQMMNLRDPVISLLAIKCQKGKRQKDKDNFFTLHLNSVFFSIFTPVIYIFCL